MWVFWKELVKRALPKKRDALGVQCKELIKENSQVWLDDEWSSPKPAGKRWGRREISLSHTLTLSLTCSITLLSAPETNANSCSSTASLRERYSLKRKIGRSWTKSKEMTWHGILSNRAAFGTAIAQGWEQLNTARQANKSTSSSMISVRIALDCSDSIQW